MLPSLLALRFQNSIGIALANVKPLSTLSRLATLQYRDQPSNLLVRRECTACLPSVYREIGRRYQSVGHVFSSFRAPAIDRKQTGEPHGLHIWLVLLSCGFIIIVDSRRERVHKGKRIFIHFDAPECFAQRPANLTYCFAITANMKNSYQHDLTKTLSQP